MIFHALDSYLLDARDFLEVAVATCRFVRDVHAIPRCRVTLHAPSGRPVIGVDTLPAAAHDAHAGQVLLLPVVNAHGLLASIRCEHRTSYPRHSRRELELIADRVAARLARLGITTNAGLSQLTARQLDVAQLAASGRTNPEIADVLGLSENTVKKHLKDIYARLDVSNRTALASMVAAIVPRGDDAVPLGVTQREELTITRCA